MGRYFRNSGVAAFLLATILAGGALVAWGVVTAITGMNLITSFSGRPSRENLQMTVTGRPLISVWTSGRNATNEYLSLDRKVVPSGELLYKKSRSVTFLQPQSLVADTTDQSHSISFDWIRGFTNGNVPQKLWYLVREGDAQEFGYLVGYEVQSAALVGFLGTGGIRIEKPPREEQFNFGARSFNGTTAAIWGGGIRGAIPNYIGPRDGGGRLAIVSLDQLYFVDLASQRVKHVPLAEPVISISMGNEPVDAEDDYDQEMRVTVRTPAHVLVLDWEGQTLRTIPIPSALIDKDIGVYLPVASEIVLSETRSTNGGYPFTYELYWLDTESHVTRRESVMIAGPEGMGVQVLHVLVGSMPSPSVLTVFGYLITESVSKDVDVAEMRMKVWSGSWHLYSLVCLLSAALAVQAFRHQRRYEPRTAPAWAVFVFLLGPAGLLGYLAHRRWPVIDQCATCGARVPHDRENCRSCQAEFPAPPLLGGEVFA